MKRALISALLTKPQPIMAPSVTVTSFFIHPATKAAVPGITLRSLPFTTRATPAQHALLAPPQQGNKYLSISTGELFLDIAALIFENAIKNVNRREENEIPVVGMSAEEEGDWWWRWMKTIAAVVEDPIQAEAVWGQRVKDVEAESLGGAVSSPGFSFSAAGLLFPYHLGVAQLLIEKGYIKNTTPLAGSSAGAIVCAVIASGMSMREALKATKILAEDCRLRGTAFRIGAVLRDILDQYLSDDVHIRSNGRVRVSVTEILRRPRGLLVDQFDSKQDLINAVLASSFIPGYFAPEPVTIFRNRLCLDGGITLLTPPTSASYTVRVCAYPASRLGLQGIVISPDCNPENMPSTRELLNWAIKPAADDILDKLFELGYLNAAIWAEKNPVEVSS